MGTSFPVSPLRSFLFQCLSTPARGLSWSTTLGMKSQSLPWHSRLLRTLPSLSLTLLSFWPTKGQHLNATCPSMPLSPCTCWPYYLQGSFHGENFPFTLQDSMKGHLLQEALLDSPSPLYLLFQGVYVVGHHCVIMSVSLTGL